MRRRSLGWVTISMVLGAGCADPCLDDGLGQDVCPEQNTDSAGDSDSATESDSVSASASDSNSASASASASDSNSSNSDSNTASASDSDSDSDTDGTQYCADNDMDGFGDPDDCTDEPGDGRVPNADDCDDSSAQTFPGAAQSEDEESCRKDEDDDGYGDSDPPDGVDPGGDCDDDDDNTFPGSAENEDPDTCTRDADGDGWGDANPGDGIDPGADCVDSNELLNPNLLALTGIVGDQVATVDASDASLTSLYDIDVPMFQGWDPVSATIADDGTLWATDNAGDELTIIDYQSVCDGTNTAAPITDAPMDHDLSVICGISFGPDGELYGLHTASDSLVVFDTTTGLAIDAIPVTLDDNPLPVGSCGLSYDCHEGRLLWASGVDGNVYALDHETGAATLLADTDGNWNPTGIAYDPVERQVYIAGAAELLRVQIDGSDTVESIGNMSFGMGDQSVSNLEYLPICSDSE